jgi:hypothetical protein
MARATKLFMPPQRPAVCEDDTALHGRFRGYCACH